MNKNYNKLPEGKMVGPQYGGKIAAQMDRRGTLEEGSSLVFISPMFSVNVNQKTSSISSALARDQREMILTCSWGGKQITGEGRPPLHSLLCIKE